MTIWKNCELETYFSDDRPVQRQKCEVRVTGREIVASYVDDYNERSVYKGNEVGEGHYKLIAQGFDGRATLHQIPDDDVLEGFWAQGGDIGMWRILLDE